MVSVQLVVAVWTIGAEVGDGVVTGLELRLVEHLLAVEQVAAVQVAGQADAAAVDGDDRVGLEDVGAAAGQPHRQLRRRRQVRARSSSPAGRRRAGVAADFARTTPMLMVPVAPLIESRSAS